MKNFYLYLDDERFPKTDKPWTIVRSFDEFKRAILDNGLPGEMSLDHDLGENLPTGYDCVKWLVHTKKYDLRNVIINVHSANGVGKDNMEGLIKSWNKFLEKEESQSN